MNLNLNFQTDKKKIIIIASAILVLILIIGLIIFLVQRNKSNNKNQSINNTEKVFTPDFLSAEEKTKMQIPVDMKIQATTRDENGKVTVYRIIKTDADIVNPDKVTPISPHAQQTGLQSN